jgi:hypothetical protein
MLCRTFYLLEFRDPWSSQPRLSNSSSLYHCTEQPERPWFSALPLPFYFPKRPDRSFLVLFPCLPGIRRKGSGANAARVSMHCTFIFPRFPGRKSRDPGLRCWGMESWCWVTCCLQNGATGSGLHPGRLSQGLWAVVMEDGCPRIRRRVSVRKRNRGNLENLRASPTPAELQPAEDTEDEAAAGSRRRKTGSPEHAQVQPCWVPASPLTRPVLSSQGLRWQPRVPPRARLRGRWNRLLPRCTSWVALARSLTFVILLSPSLGRHCLNPRLLGRCQTYMLLPSPVIKSIHGAINWLDREKASLPNGSALLYW